MQKAIYDERYRRAISLLRHTRQELGMSQAELAENLGWHRTMLSNIEIFERRLDLLEAYLLAAALNLQLSDLELLLKERTRSDM